MATNNTDTSTSTVPSRVYIQFDGESEPRTTAIGDISLGKMDEHLTEIVMNEMLNDGIGIQFLIERAMEDPDATVISLD